MEEIHNSHSIQFQYLTEIEHKEGQPDELNSGNHWEYAPFIVNKEQQVVSYQEGFVSQNNEYMQLIEGYLKEKDYKIVKVKDNEIPIPHEKQNKGYEMFWICYSTWVNMFQYQKWFAKIAQDIDDKQHEEKLSVLSKQDRLRVKIYQYDGGERWIVKLNKYEIDQLLEIGNLRVLTGKKLRDDHFEDLESISNIIDLYLKGLGTGKGLFIKNHTKSVKNEMTLKPLTSSREAIDQLSCSKDVLWRWNEDKENFLILMPYVDIDYQREFRVFVNNHVVTAIAQQKWYQKLKWRIGFKEVESICILWEEIGSRLGLYNVVLDVYIDQDGVSHLIECNPGYMWGSSGGSLYNWVVDFKYLQNNQPITVRTYIDKSLEQQDQVNNSIENQEK